MTVAALTETRAQISGDGVTDRVDLTFQFVDEADLRLIHTDSGGTDTEWVFQQSPGNWSFSGGDYSAGTIHFTASDLAVGERLTVVLTSQYDQMLSLDGGEIDPSVLERGMDKAALQIQSIAGEVGRALRVSPSLSGNLPDLEVPDLPDGHTFVREGDELVPALLDSNEIAMSVAAAQTARVAAEGAQVDAETAQSAAETSATNAETAESNASSSATTASSSATAAASSATSAAGSATSAANSASSAALAKSAAETAETNAETAENNASSSAASASSSASSASSSASSASGSASSAASSATAAAGSATSAANSASSASSSAASAAAAAASAAGSAASTSFTAAGNLEADNVQDALEELDSEKAPASAVAGIEAKLGAIAILEYQLPVGSSGGDATSGSRQTYPLNTEVSDPEGIVSLSSHQFTITEDALCVFEASFVATSNSKLILRNVTDGVDVGTSLTVYLRSGSSSHACMTSGTAVLTAGKTYELQYEVARTQSTNGLGLVTAGVGPVEVFGRVTLRAI